jgi:hypothetical protein
MGTFWVEPGKAVENTESFCPPASALGEAATDWVGEGGKSAHCCYTPLQDGIFSFPRHTSSAMQGPYRILLVGFQSSLLTQVRDGRARLFGP